MATGAVTITTAATFLPELWSSSIQEAAHVNAIIVDRCDRSLEAELQNGDRINRPNLAEITSNNLTIMTGSITFNTYTEGNSALVLDTLTYAAVKFDSAVRVQAVSGLFEKYSKELGRSIQAKIDLAVGALFASFSQTAGTDAVAITDATIRSAIQQLDEANAPSGSADRTFFVTPATKFDLFGIERYVSMLNNSMIGGVDGSKGRGYMGDIYDVAVYETTNLTTRQMAIMHRDALLFAQAAEVNVEMRQPHDELADVVRSWVMWGDLEARDTFGVYVKGN